MAVVLVESVLSGNAMCALLPNKRIVSVPSSAEDNKVILESTMYSIEDAHKRRTGEDISTEDLFEAIAKHMQGQVLLASLWKQDEYDEVRGIIKEAGMKYV
jgi:hypothetical protein